MRQLSPKNKRVVLTTCIALIFSLLINPYVNALSWKDEDDFKRFASLNDIVYYDPYYDTCIGGSSADPGYNTIGDEVEVGVTIFGGTWDGSVLKRDSSDDNGTGLMGSHAGHTMFAELSNSGTQDFAALATLLKPPEEYLGWAGYKGFRPGSKFLLTYKDKKIIIEKRDVGGGGGPIQGKVRAVDIWYETAKLIDFREGTAVMKIQQVTDDTPVTPLDGKPFTSLSSEEELTTVPSASSTGARVFLFLLNKGLTRNQALGIVGNLMRESGGGTLNLNPKAENPSSGAYGIAQWTRGRKESLLRYASYSGGADFQIQVNFLWGELNDPYYKTSVLDPILASNTIEESAKIFLENYEIPCVGDEQCSPFLKDTVAMAESAKKDLEGIGGADNNTCEQVSGESGKLSTDGYSFPLGKGFTFDPSRLSCSPCHHDGSHAMDLMASPGTPVFAIYDGVIYSNKLYTRQTDDPLCRSVQFKADDGWIYWYGHTYITAEVGTRFKAGQNMGSVGSDNCGWGSAHLHIDRGSPKGYTGGEEKHRDPGITPLIQKLMKEQVPH